jgi:hypothetical protein
VRKVLTAMLVLVVLVWLIRWDLQPDGEIQAPPPVAPVVATPAASPTEQADSGRALVAPESAPDVAQPPAPKPHAPATTMAMALQMWGEQGIAGPVSSLFQQRENAFVAEPLDPLWSRSREAEILGRIAQINGLRLINIEVECRTSMCRLQWTQNAPVFVEDEVKGLPNDVYEGLLARLGYTQMIPMGNAFVGDKGGGGITSLTYLPRLDVEGP